MFKISKTQIASLVVVSLFTLLVFSAGAFQQEERKAKNLKVLPKDISHEDLEREMHFYNKSLNVKCNYCHAPSKERPGRLDFASDSNSHKEETREMMRMTNDINEKYFQTKPNTAQHLNTVNCYTCHRGEEMPLVLPPADSTKK
jgi:hypothetical protein